MAFKEFIRDYLGFTRKERIGITVIIILFFIVFFFPFLTSHRKSAKGIQTDSTWLNTMRKLEQKNEDTNDQKTTKKYYTDDDKRDYLYDQKATGTAPTLFYFDPNTLSREKWKQLGIQERTIVTIQNYLSKGGTFRKVEDLQKVYGLSKNAYDRLAPYVKIENVASNYSYKDLDTEKITAEKISPPPFHYKVLDINTADTVSFISLPGIGSKLALRIINFRDKLGGFYSVDQVKETYGVPDSVFQNVKQYLKCEHNSIKKININTATKEELKTHPYIKWNIANAIVEYRNQHGLFATTEDLKKIQAISNDAFNKIIPYLTL